MRSRARSRSECRPFLVSWSYVERSPSRLLRSDGSRGGSFRSGRTAPRRPDGGVPAVKQRRRGQGCCERPESGRHDPRNGRRKIFARKFARDGGCPEPLATSASGTRMSLALRGGDVAICQAKTGTLDFVSRAEAVQQRWCWPARRTRFQPGSRLRA